MSYLNRKDKYNPVKESLFEQKPAGLVIRSLEGARTLEPKLDGSESHVDDAPRVLRDSQGSDWIMSKERMEYRHEKILAILDEMIARSPKESFDSFLERIYSIANLTLNKANKATTGDECEDLADRWVMRFIVGCRLMSRSRGIGWKTEEEALLFKLIREECDMLTKQDVQFAESRSSVRLKKRSWERKPTEDDHPTDYRENIGGTSHRQ